MGLYNVLWEWDYPMCSGKKLANLPWEWDYPMCTRNGTSQCALKMGQANVVCEWG